LFVNLRVLLMPEISRKVKIGGGTGALIAEETEARQNGEEIAVLIAAETAAQTAEEETEVLTVVAGEIVIAAQTDAATVVLTGDATGIAAESAVLTAADVIVTAAPRKIETVIGKKSVESDLLWWTEKSSADSERSMT